MPFLVLLAFAPGVGALGRNVQGAAGAAGAGRLDVVARALEHEREADDYFRIADVRPSSRPGQLRVRIGGAQDL